ncbi:hypothetical protein T10_4960 [Trichinella papuae]|uniref:Uncharacterized protein n=1 Tax=Trichinella papuae TaxID=268474 RepID=A0A0V1MG92_9BILA|nr:hypothetical protein T10_4960 [Trichinella papuae]
MIFWRPGLFRSGDKHCYHLPLPQLRRSIPPELVLDELLQDATAAELDGRVRQCSHWDRSMRYRISLTRFAANGFHLQGSPLIQLKLMFLSLQQVDRSKLNSHPTYAFKRAARSAAINSSRGRLSCLTGAIWVLPMTNLTSFAPPRDPLSGTPLRHMLLPKHRQKYAVQSDRPDLCEWTSTRVGV